MSNLFHNTIAKIISPSMEYQAIGRTLIWVDELPQSALARYERDIRDRDTVYVIQHQQ